MVSELLAKLDDSYTVEKTKEMIGIPSIVGEEGELAEYLREELVSLGLKVEMQEVHPGRPNVYAKIDSGRPGRRLNFNGHTDTVPVVEGWETDPFKPLKKEGKLYGLGACDMKSGIACILNTIKAFSESGYEFNGELSFSAVIDEEALGEGAKAMLKTEYKDVDAIVLAEPYPGDDSKPIPLGITGKILYDIYVRGRAAHAFRPHLGINAIEDAGRIIANLDNLEFREHPRFGRGNYSTIKIQGGYEVYSVVVPAMCRFEVNRLIVPGETVESSIMDMERLVRSLDLKSDVEVKTKPPMYAAFEINPDEAILKVFEEVYRDVMDVEPKYEYAYGITDANTFTGLGGIPCLHLGPARGGAHQANEYVSLEWLPRISQMYALIATRFLGD